MALPCSRQQDLRGQAVVVAETPLSSRAAALSRLAAITIGRGDTALGASYRRPSARVGKQKPVTATARKIAVLFYNALRFGMTYRAPGATAYDE